MNKVPRVGVGAVILGKNKKIFLSQRGENAKNERGLWEGPGGGVDFGETLRDALVREVKEEYNFTIEPVELLTLCDHILLEEGQHWVAPSYLSKVVSGTPQIMEPDKSMKFGWFSRDEMRGLPLTMTGQLDLATLDEKYPDDLPDLYN